MSLTSRFAVAASGALRSVGAALEGMGKGIEVTKYTEKLVPSTRFVAVDGIAPAVSGTNSFVAPSASVVGDVSIGEHSSVWYGATVRGDVNKVTVGTKSSIGDRAVVHVAKIQGDRPTFIGDNVTIGSCAIIHACTIKNSVVIGDSAQVLDGAVVDSNSIIAPGSVVTPGTNVPSGELWSGSPAKKVRALTAEEIAAIGDSAQETLELAYLHSVENSKDYKQLITEAEDRLDRELRVEGEAWFDPNQPDEDDVLGQGAPGRIFNSTLTHPEEGLKFREEQKKASGSQ